MMRVRMRRWMLEELKGIALRDAEFLSESWTMSDLVREVLLAYIQRRRAEFRAIEDAGFSGGPPPAKDALTFYAANGRDKIAPLQDRPEVWPELTG